MGLQCHNGSTHRILTLCFDKQQAALVAFLNAFAENSSAPAFRPEPFSTVPCEPQEVNDPPFESIPVCEGTLSMPRIEICLDNGSDELESLFSTAWQAAEEHSLLKSYCRYIGHAGREVDAVV
jgi:hypothetical protein